MRKKSLVGYTAYDWVKKFRIPRDSLSNPPYVTHRCIFRKAIKKWKMGNTKVRITIEEI